MATTSTPVRHRKVPPTRTPGIQAQSIVRVLDAGGPFRQGGQGGTCFQRRIRGVCEPAKGTAARIGKVYTGAGGFAQLILPIRLQCLRSVPGRLRCRRRLQRDGERGPAVHVGRPCVFGACGTGELLGATTHADGWSFTWHQTLRGDVWGHVPRWGWRLGLSR